MVPYQVMRRAELHRAQVSESTGGTQSTATYRAAPAALSILVRLANGLQRPIHRDPLRVPAFVRWLAFTEPPPIAIWSFGCQRDNTRIRLRIGYVKTKHRKEFAMRTRRAANVTIADYGPLKPNQWYVATIVRARKLHRPQKLQFTFKLLDRDQEGRELQIERPVPIRPNDLTAHLLRALGIDACVGSTIDLASLKQRRVSVRFAVEQDQAVPTAFKATPSKRSSQASPTASAKDEDLPNE
jgi:hypothetical protein